MYLCRLPVSFRSNAIDMAAWIPRTVVQAAKNQYAYNACQIIQSRDYANNQPRVIKNPTTASLKRGTGGRSSFNGMVCTVFGGNGFIGKNICSRLGKIGTQIIIPHRCEACDVVNLRMCGDLGQVLFQPFNLKDEESIIKCMKYSNVVINLIGTEVSTKNFSLYDVNVEGARTIARLAKQCDVQHFVHVSCLNASHDPPPIILTQGSEILRTKWGGETAVREEFPTATIVRPGTVYGQNDNFLNHYMDVYRQFQNQVPLWDNGEKTEKQPVHISDVTTGIMAVLTNPSTAGQTYQFVGPKRYKLRDLIQWFHDVVAYGTEVEGDVQRTIPLNYHYVFQAKITVREILRIIYPTIPVTWEILEKEHVSDTVEPGIPTLEDLGIVPIEMESRIYWELRPFYYVDKYQHTLTEFARVTPPKPIPLI